ncbi:MAG: 1-acyl-sn-glycerol-3-phosphate acyltransferase [Chitinophagales bacterium]|nr:1-acyl-sn-glycerol-3-phosphate acyltransferase [Bacteroidota bacterium]MCB9043546.1 1-acyl-sn-glycerol-3-phosphate acyltransferase [Chitinophagales bacterium]
MIKFILKLLFKLKGWKVDRNVPPEVNRCVMLGVPHTSNWDFVITVAAMDIMNVPLRFTIKKEWMRFPFNLIVKPVGGLAIDRTPRKVGEERPSMTQVMAELFEKYPKLALVVTPEGTRKKVTKWKTGFYYTAAQAKVPIACAYVDYARKICGVGKIVDSALSLEEAMDEVCLFYLKKGVAAHPELFSVDVDALARLKAKNLA